MRYATILQPLSRYDFPLLEGVWCSLPPAEAQLGLCISSSTSIPFLPIPRWSERSSPQMVGLANANAVTFTEHGITGLHPVLLQKGGLLFWALPWELVQPTPSNSQSQQAEGLGTCHRVNSGRFEWATARAGHRLLSYGELVRIIQIQYQGAAVIRMYS